MEDMNNPNLLKFKNIKVIYTSNLKGNLEEITNLTTLTNEEKEKKPNVLLTLGNTSWGDDACNYFKGEPMWKAIKMAGYDGMVPGPDDFLHGWKNLKNFIPKLGVPATICNLYLRDEDVRVTEEIKPYLVINKYYGLKIGLIGVMDEKIDFERTNDVFLEYGDNAVRWAVKKLKEQKCNFIILMAYLTMEKCIEYAYKVDGLDLIICGHGEEGEMPGLIRENNCYISCENTKGGKVAVLDIDIGEM